MPRLLVVDDEQSICWGLRCLGEEMGHEVWTASSAEQALELIDQQEKTPDVIVLDVRLPGMDGLQAMGHIQQRCASTPVIMVTAYGDLQTAVAAVRNGAFEYIVKPFDLEKVQRALTRALAHRAQPAGQPRRETVGGLLGRSTPMQEVFKRIALASASDINVLLCGESGTGKELAARAIHQFSSRSAGPFIAVNIAALNPSLAEGELFGHLQGAFTGADRNREGLLVQANQGTLFLDEVADIPLNIQAKLLRALEHKEVLPIGGNQPAQSSFRVISASHQNLLANVQKGTFRHDLFFRLGAFEIEMPALRERAEDIPALAEYFLGLMQDNSRSQPLLSDSAIAVLKERPWYGNVRELRNAVEHAAMLARGSTIEPEHLPPPATYLPPAADADISIDRALAALVTRWTTAKLNEPGEVANLYAELLQVVEPPLLAAALQSHQHQVAAAARALGLHRTTLKKKLDEYGSLKFEE